MARLGWAAVLLALFLVNCDAVVDKVDLARLVSQLLNLYKPSALAHGEPPMFSLAISIPKNAARRLDFSQVVTADPPADVRSAMDRCQVYVGTRVVAATLLKYPDFKTQCPNEPVTWEYVTQRCPSVRLWRDFEQCSNNEIKQLKRMVDGLVQHAEYRVLQNFATLRNRLNRGLKSSDLMLFYTYKSPCYSRCCSTDHTFSILQAIPAITGWNNYAVVFSNIFVPGRTSDSAAVLEQNRRSAISSLGTAVRGVGNVFRCTQSPSQCVSCENPRTVGVNDDCVRNPRSSSAPPGGHG